MNKAKPKPKRIVFVLMPFTKTPLRDKDDLTEFFKTNIKSHIESEQSLQYQYVVRRSDDSFDITAQIIRDVYAADIVLCDLSGPNANPNVMYELGMRLAISNKPVILIREAHTDNKPIFDISGFHTYEYSPTQYRKLEEYIVGKLRKFETGEETYESPVLKILKTEPSVTVEVTRKRVLNLLTSFFTQVEGMRRLVGGALDAFLATYNIPHTFKTTDETLLFLSENQDTLKRLPWHQFSFLPHSMPAINAFLVDLPLDDLVPDTLHREVNTFISEYYHLFLGSEYIWHVPSFMTVYTFLGESRNLREILAGSIALVSQIEQAKEEEIIELMRDIFKHSIFAENLDQPEAILAAKDLGDYRKKPTTGARKSQKKTKSRL